MSGKVKVAGVGMIPFTKPGASDSYDVMGATAARLALDDAGISFDQIGQAYVGYVYGDSTCGQAALYRLGTSGVPMSTSITTAQPALPHCFWRARQLNRGWSTAHWHLDSSK